MYLLANNVDGVGSTTTVNYLFQVLGNNGVGLDPLDKKIFNET